MTQVDEDAIFGRLVKKHEAAKRRLALLVEDAEESSHVLRRISEALGQDQPWRKADHIEVTLRSLKQEGFDFSKLTEDSLSTLRDDLHQAIKDETEAKDARCNLS